METGEFIDDKCSEYAPKDLQRPSTANNGSSTMSAGPEASVVSYANLCVVSPLEGDINELFL